MQVLLNIPEDSRPGIAAARLRRNASLPQTVSGEPDEEGNPTTIPNPDLLASDEEYIVFVLTQAVQSYNSPAPAPTPTPNPPPVIDGVPQEVTRRQAIQALILNNKLHLVQPAIDAIPDATQRAIMQSEWSDSQTFQRQRQSLITMAMAIGLTLTDLDNLFKQAATL